MASQVEIMNRAAAILGEERISSPSEDVKVARELSATWAISRRALLRGYRWGFAMKRAALAALSTAPAHQFDYQYQLPADFLRLDFVGDWFAGLSMTDYRNTDESEWALANVATGTVIETSLPAPLNIRYVADIETTTFFDALFVEAFAGKLAVDVATTLTNSSGRLDAARAAFGMAIGEAIRTSAIERPPVALPDDSWIMSRL